MQKFIKKLLQNIFIHFFNFLKKTIEIRKSLVFTTLPFLKTKNIAKLFALLLQGWGRGDILPGPGTGHGIAGLDSLRDGTQGINHLVFLFEKR